MLYFLNCKNNQKFSSVAVQTVALFCIVSTHLSIYASQYGHVWGEETRSGIWQPKSYELHHNGFELIKYPKKCENKSCITLHVGCTYADYSNLEEKVFSASVLIERHPNHPKQPNPFKVPNYSSKASIWLNDQKFPALLKRSSLFYAFFYGISYFWSVSFDAELFDKIPLRELQFQMESEDQLFKVQAVFDVSKEEEAFKHMKSICPRHTQEEPEQTSKRTLKKSLFPIKNLVQK